MGGAGGETGLQALVDCPEIDDLCPTDSVLEVSLEECSLPLPTAPEDPTRVNVALDCAVLDATTAWAYDAAANAITLADEVCATLTDQGVARVDVLFGGPACRGVEHYIMTVRAGGS